MIKTKQQEDIRNLLDLTKPLPASVLGEGPLLPNVQEHRAPRHPDGCECTDCWNAGVRFADYLHQKRMNEL